jgi:hypothetical protein
MSSPSYDTQGKHEQQDWADQEWEEMVKQVLPTNLEEKAIELCAWSRKRGVRSIADLLRALLVYASCGYSFQDLGIWATLKGVGHISATAWRKRFDKSGSWIDWLVRDMLKGEAAQSAGRHPVRGRGRIMLIDATRLKTVGGTGDDLRLHWAYDFQGGRTEQVEITDHHDAESLSHFHLQKGDIAVLDAGYPVPTTVQEAEKQGIDVVLRATASHLRLETDEGKVINLRERLKRQPYGETCRIEAQVKMKNGTRRAVLLIAHRLPKDLSLQAQERKRKQLRAKRGRHFNQELVWWAGWVLLITTLDEQEWSNTEVLRLYRARWQIELIFKRLKQILNLHCISIQDWSRARIVAQLHLIVWLMQEGVQNWLGEEFQGLCQPETAPCSYELDEDGGSVSIASSWRITHLSSEQVQIMLRGTWPTKRIAACLEQLRRYLFVRRRPKRPHQETAFRDWLSRKMSALAVTSAP